MTALRAILSAMFALPVRAVLAACLLAAATGCVGPNRLRHLYPPAPVDTDAVRVVVREARRGPEGAVLTLAVTNLATDQLSYAAGARVTLFLDDGTRLAALSPIEAETLAGRRGSAALGVGRGEWGEARRQLAAERLELATGQTGLMHIAVALPAEAARVTLDVAPALQWTRPDRAAATAPLPILLTVPLPEW